MNTENSPKKHLFSLEALGIVLGYSSFFAGLAWLFGAMYYAGQFKALGIEGNTINYSNEFLISVGAISLIEPLLRLFILYLIFIFEPELSQEIAKKGYNLFKNRLQLSDKKAFFIQYLLLLLSIFSITYSGLSNKKFFSLSDNRFDLAIYTIVIILFLFDVALHTPREFETLNAKEVEKEANFNSFFRTGIIVIVAMFILISSMVDVTQRAYISACENINSTPSTITIYTTIPLTKIALFSPHNTALYQYSAFLAKIGDDHLIVFEDTDSTTLVPNETYYITKSEVVSYKIEHPTELITDKKITDTCKSKALKIFQ